MVLPVPDYALNDSGNYSGSGTVAHAHRSFVLGGAGYDLSAAPDGTLVIIWASLGHEHNDIDLTPGEVVGRIYTGSVTEYTGDPATELAGSEITGWSTTAWNVSVPSSVIIVHGWAFYATLGDGTGGTINKALFTQTDGSGNSELCIEYSGGVTYPQTDSWVTPIVRIYEPNAGNNAVVDVADIQNFEGTGDPSTLSIASFTTGQDDTHLELLTESIAGTWDNNDPGPGSWDDDGSGDGGYSQGWSLDVATAGTVAAQSVTNQNSGQPDGHVGVLIPVYYEASSPTGTATGTFGGLSASATGVGGATRDVRFQTGSVDVTTDGQTVTLPTSVGSLDNAFVFIAGNRHQGAGPVGSASTQHADDMGVVAELTAVDTITFGYDGGNGTRVQWVVMEYVGAPGGANEFIVRGRHNFTFTSDTNQTTALTNAPTNVNKVIPFIRGISSSHASAGSNNLGARAWMSNTGNTLNVACSQEDDTTTVGITAVEFTGSNWSVGHMAWNGATSDGPIDRPLVQEADGDSGGTSFDVGDWATAAIMSWGHASDDANEAIADGWPLWEPTPASTTQVRWTFDANHDGADDDYVVHVLQHDDMAVTRYSDTSSAADETTVDVTSAGLTDLTRSLVLGTSITSGSGTAYGRGWRVYYLNSLTEAAHWSHRSGNTMAHRLEVIDFADVSTPYVAPGGVEGTATGSFGSLSAAVTGTRGRTGIGTGVFGALSASVTGVRGRTTATATGAFGGLTASATGTVTGGITGTGTGTFGALTASVSGLRVAVGTATATFGALATSIDGRRTRAGTATGSFGALSSSVAGRVGTSGTVTGSFGALSAAVTGQRTRAGTATGTFGALTATAIGQGASPQGTATGTFGALTASVTGQRARTGTGTGTFGALSVSVSGQRTRSGTISTTFGSLSTVVTGTRGRTGTTTGTFGALTASATGTTPGNNGTATGSFGALVATGIGVRGRHGTISTTFGALSAAVTGVTGVTGTASATFAALAATGTGIRGRSGTATGTFGGLSAIYVETPLVYVSDADVSRVDPIRTAARTTLTVRTARRADPVRTGAVPWDL